MPGVWLSIYFQELELPSEYKRTLIDFATEYFM